MNRAHLAMAYQACEVADLARAAVDAHDRADAIAHASRVLAAAHQLVAAANRLESDEVPAESLQLFAYEHPEEAAADLADWVRRHGG